MFDTEAQHYDVHLVSVDSVCFDPDAETGTGDMVTLHEEAVHRSGRRKRDEMRLLLWECHTYLDKAGRNASLRERIHTALTRG